MCYNLPIKTGARLVMTSLIQRQSDTPQRGEDMLSKEAAEARRKYKREWASRNPDKIRAQQARYWERKAHEQAAGKTDEKPAVRASPNADNPSP